MDLLNTGLAEQLAADYQAAKLEYERESHVEELEGQQQELRDKFGGAPSLLRFCARTPR